MKLSTSFNIKLLFLAFKNPTSFQFLSFWQFFSPEQEVFDSSHSPASSPDLWGSVGGKAWLEFRTNTLLIDPPGIFMTGWCVSVKGMLPWVAESTHRGRRHCGWKLGGAGGSIHNKANSLRQINKYSKAFFCWEFHPRRPCGSHRERERNW